MIAATHTPTNTAVRITDAENGCARIETLDGSMPFSREAARLDPETPGRIIRTFWAWVNRNELSGIYTV